MVRERLKLLSTVTLVVAVLLLASYASQVILPFATGQTTVTVNLLDPSLLVFEVLLILLTVAWVYVGAVNLLWARRLGGRIKKVRAEEAKILKQIRRLSRTLLSAKNGALIQLSAKIEYGGPIRTDLGPAERGQHDEEDRGLCGEGGGPDIREGRPSPSSQGHRRNPDCARISPSGPASAFSTSSA